MQAAILQTSNHLRQHVDYKRSRSQENVDDQVRDNFITQRSAIQTHHNVGASTKLENYLEPGYNLWWSPGNSRDLNYRIHMMKQNNKTGVKCILIMKQQLVGRQEAGIISESALPYERLDIYFHHEDCLAQISWDEIKTWNSSHLLCEFSFVSYLSPRDDWVPWLINIKVRGVFLDNIGFVQQCPKALTTPVSWSDTVATPTSGQSRTFWCRASMLDTWRTLQCWSGYQETYQERR